MSKKSTPSIRPKVELLIIGVFFLSFIVWAMSKCNASSVIAELNEKMEEEGPDSLTSTAGESTTDPYGTPLPAATPETATSDPTPSTPSALSNTATNAASNDPANSYSKLYVTIDGLNMRTGPHLDSTVIHKLPLFEEVWFLNEVTDSTQKISLGTEIADEPWVKIKHIRGQVGWVYGAGVNYYRKKR